MGRCICSLTLAALAMVIFAGTAIAQEYRDFNGGPQSLSPANSDTMTLQLEDEGETYFTHGRAFYGHRGYGYRFYTPYSYRSYYSYYPRYYSNYSPFYSYYPRYSFSFGFNYYRPSYYSYGFYNPRSYFYPSYRYFYGGSRYFYGSPYCYPINSYEGVGAAITTLLGYDYEPVDSFIPESDEGPIVIPENGSKTRFVSTPSEPVMESPIRTTINYYRPFLKDSKTVKQVSGDLPPTTSTITEFASPPTIQKRKKTSFAEDR